MDFFSSLLEFGIPVPIFADGFESGDVSAWSYTSAESKGNKKANQASLRCTIRGQIR